MYFKKNGSRDPLVLSFVWQLFDWHSFGGLFRSLVVYWTTLRTLNLFKTVLLWMFDVWSVMNCESCGRKWSWPSTKHLNHGNCVRTEIWTCDLFEFETGMPQLRNRNATTTKQGCHNHETGMPQLRNRDATTTKQGCHNHETVMSQQRNMDATTTKQGYHNHETGMPQPRNMDATTTKHGCHNYETGMPQPRNRDATTTKQGCHSYETGMPQLRNRDATHSTGPFPFDSWAIMQACPSWRFCAKVK